MLFVGDGPRPTELKGDDQKVPSARVLKSAAHSRSAGASIVASAKRFGGTTVCKSGASPEGCAGSSAGGTLTCASDC